LGFDLHWTLIFRFPWLSCLLFWFGFRLNILAELLCFGDREFYKDWWNAKTVEEVRCMLKAEFISFRLRTLNRTDINHILMHFNAMVFWGFTSVLEDVEHGNLLLTSIFRLYTLSFS